MSVNERHLVEYLKEQTENQELTYQKQFIDRDKFGRSLGTAWLLTDDKNSAEAALRFHYSKIGNSRIKTMLMGFTYETELVDEEYESDDDEMKEKMAKMEKIREMELNDKKGKEAPKKEDKKDAEDDDGFEVQESEKTK